MTVEQVPTPGAAPQGQGTPQPEKYAVKVDGEDREFTLDELKQHASKVAAADRRFEEAASLKKELQDAQELKELIDNDPEFVDALQQAYEQKYGAGGKPPAQQPPQGNDDDRPLTRKEVATMVNESLQMAEAQRQLVSDIKDLRGQYGEFDDKALLRYCDEHAMWGDVKEAYKAWKFDDLVGKRVTTEKDKLIAELKASRRLSEPKAGGEGGVRVPLNMDPNRSLDQFATDIAAKYNAGELDEILKQERQE